MKNLFTLFILLVSITMLSAQIQKGSILIGGTVGFNNIGSDGSSITVINLSPSAGFFLSNRFVLGGTLDLTGAFGPETSNWTIGLTPFGRYYFNGSGKTRIFGQADAGFQLAGDGNGDPVAIFGLVVGIDFFLNDNVAIEGSLGYRRLQDPEVSAGVNNIGLNFGVAAFIGGGKK